MGLDTSHGAWSGPYSSFAEWRGAVAEAAGFPPLDDMRGFGGSIPWSDPRITDQGLVLLLNHSDCDGEISPSDCARIADSLERLLGEFRGEESEYYRDRTREFIEGCRAAARANQHLIFR